MLANQFLPGLAAGSANPGLAPNLSAVAGLQHAVVHIGLVGDVNGDGTVGGGDLAALLAAWGLTGADGFQACDLNVDGRVDAADLAVMLAQWGQS